MHEDLFLDHYFNLSVKTEISKKQTKKRKNKTNKKKTQLNKFRDARISWKTKIWHMINMPAKSF